MSDDDVRKWCVNICVCEGLNYWQRVLHFQFYRFPLTVFSEKDTVKEKKSLIFCLCVTAVGATYCKLLMLLTLPVQMKPPTFCAFGGLDFSTFSSFFLVFSLFRLSSFSLSSSFSPSQRLSCILWKASRCVRCAMHDNRVRKYYKNLREICS